MKYIASISNGAGSVAMLLKLLELGYPISGVVHVCMGQEIEYQSVQRISQQVDDLLRTRGIPYYVGFPEESMYALLSLQATSSVWGGANGWCGRRCRYGLSLKLAAIDRLETQIRDDPSEPIVEYIGLCSSERSRVVGLRQNLYRDRVKIFPLCELGFTKQQAIEYAHSQGFFWHEHTDGGRVVDLYDLGFSSVSCRYCRFTNLTELRILHKHFRSSYWRDLEELQRQNSEPFVPNGPSIFELGDRFTEEERQGNIFDLFNI